MSEVNWSSAPAWAHGVGEITQFAGLWYIGHDKYAAVEAPEVTLFFKKAVFPMRKNVVKFQPRPQQWPETDERIDRIGRDRTEDDMGHYNRNADEVFGRDIGVYTTYKAPERATSDLINKPKHYQLIGDLEAIDVIQRVLTPEQFEGYLIGNFLKYRLRAGKKDDLAQDIAKSEWYRERANSLNSSDQLK